MDGRLVTRRLDDQSCTDRPASGAPVGLATIPDTVTLSLGFAIVGVIDVIAIHACARAVLLLTAATAGPAGAAAAGGGAARAAPGGAAPAADGGGQRREPQAPPPPVLPLTRHAEMLLPIVGCRSRAAAKGEGGGGRGPGCVRARPFPLRCREPYPRAVPDSSNLTPQQRRAAAAMLREPAAATLGLARRSAASGYQAALVGGTIRDVFLGRDRQDREFDLATDARPEQVREITARWADKTWETGIEFGTLGLRKGETVFEITTYRSDK